MIMALLVNMTEHSMVVYSVIPDLALKLFIFMLAGEGDDS
jgi:hypothetical protein